MVKGVVCVVYCGGGCFCYMIVYVGVVVVWVGEGGKNYVYVGF